MEDTHAKLSERQLAMVEANAGCLAVMLGVFSLPFVAGCVFFIVLGVSQSAQQAKLNSAAVGVQATILESSVQSSASGGGSSTPPGAGVTHFPLIRFTYRVGGTAYTGEDVWAVEESFHGRASVEAVVARYPTGARVTALVDPTDPARAFLERRWSVMPYVAAIGGVTMLSLIVGGAVGVLGWRWIGVFALAGVSASVAGFGAVVWIGQLWWLQVPADARPGWVSVAVGAAGFMAAFPVLMLWRAAKGARLYREALQLEAKGAG